MSLCPPDAGNHFGDISHFFATGDDSRSVVVSLVGRGLEAEPDVSRLAVGIVAAVTRAPMLSRTLSGSQPESEPQYIANSSWSDSGIQVDAHLINAIAAESLKKCREFHAQCICNTAWAFAKLGMRNNTLMASLSAAAIARISD